MSVPTTAIYTGSLNCDAVHTDSGATLRTTAPKDNEGDGTSFSPTDLVGVALGTCMLTTMGIVARREGWSIDGADVRTDKHMTASGPRRIERLVCHITLPSSLDDEQVAKLTRVAEACPVKKSLHPDTAVEVTVERNGEV